MEGAIRAVGLPEGAMFAGYRIERILGRGGMGIVYLASERRLERSVALKVIRPEIADDRRFRDRFRLESRTAASIEHPRVVTVFGAGEHDGLLFVAMRYVPGFDLQRFVESRGPLDPERAAGVIAEVADGLDAVHAAGLVHRDVKPANVILAQADAGGDDTGAYLTDFGLAKTIAATGGLTATGELIGTVDYMSPEQIRADRVDARADVYALGCVLFYALTGEVPFSDRESSAKMWAHLNEPPPSAARPGSGSGGLDAVIRRAMAKDPAQRYPSAGDLGRAAVAACRGEPVTEPEHSVGAGEAAPTAPTARLAVENGTWPTEPLPKRRRRKGLRRRRVWRLAAALLAVLSGLGAALLIAGPGLSSVDVPIVSEGGGVDVPIVSEGGGSSSKPGGVTIPSLVGEPLDVAESELEDLGLRSDRMGGGLFGVLVPADWEVCDTNPEAGSVAEPRSTVSLVIDRPGNC
jgi:serine/threonine protein kinase